MKKTNAYLKWFNEKQQVIFTWKQNIDFPYREKGIIKGGGEIFKISINHCKSYLSQNMRIANNDHQGFSPSYRDVKSEEKL